jgi:hypothetical protein
MLAPASLAVWIGAKAHGTGKTWIPFWDGDKAIGRFGWVTAMKTVPKRPSGHGT